MNGQPGNFGAQLRQIRRQRGISLDALARLIHYTKGYVSKVENGVRSASADFARRCDDALAAQGMLVALAVPGERRRSGWLPPAQLPRAVDGFAGRDDLLDRLDELRNGGVGLLLLAGPGGAGKTALAVHWAQRVRRLYPDGQLFVNLRGFDPDSPLTASQALDALLRGLGVNADAIPVDDDQRSALLRTRLDGRRVLVVLDNAAGEAQVRPLLPGASTCLTVVTSRDRLAGLVSRDGAMRIPVGMLADNEAVDLLRRTLGRDRVDAEPAAVVALARLCAGAPLALRIVADRIGSGPRRSLDAHAAQLRRAQDRLDLLAATGGDDASAIRRVFSWSYARLAPRHARMFRLLALPASTDLSVAAAAELAGSTPRQARADLDALAAVHLVDEIHPDRFGCHDLIRLYAAELADSDEPSAERAAALRRLLDWYLHSALAAGRLLYPLRHNLPDDPVPPGRPPMGFADYHEALAWCDEERANLAAAVELAANTGHDDIAWRLALALAGYFMLRKHWPDWISTHRTALAAAQRQRDRAGAGRLLVGLGAAYVDRGDHRTALGWLDQARAATEAAGDHVGEAAALLNLGWVYRNQGRSDEALAHLQRALVLFRSVSDHYGVARTLHRIGEVHLDRREHPEASHYLHEAVTLFRLAGNRYGESLALDSLGQYYHACAQPAHAQQYFRQALVIRRQTGNLHGQALTLRRIGALQLATNAPHATRRSWQAALRILDGIDPARAAQLHAELSALRTDPSEIPAQ